MIIVTGYNWNGQRYVGLERLKVDGDRRDDPEVYRAADMLSLKYDIVGVRGEGEVSGIERLSDERREQERVAGVR